ncbi:MAG TPA: Gfo/Idh/MocA family oxidoreductase [Bryobacteraceae bacterium]|nr:Gfo/Idh/MocA family oxidoreductase [Bryobacteraceae bacterium]
MNRREFMETSVAGMALSAAGMYSAEAADAAPKRVGLIGCGWYGKSDIFRLVQIAPVEIVSLCDVDKKAMEVAGQWAVERQASHKKPRMYTDYREMLKEKDLDMVEVATPDHWHALAMIEACKAGADIYVQKPISVDIVEGQAMLAAARKYKRVVQVGTQRRSTPHLVEARKIVQDGRLGTIGHVEIYSYGSARPNPATPAPVPETLDWEFWTGPAPLMTYSPDVQRDWRSFMEYGNGTIGDMGIHMFDMVRWFMDLGWPKRVSSFGGLRILKGGKNDIPDTQTAMFEFENVDVVWQHRRFGPSVDPNYAWGATLYGEKGTLKAGVYGYDFIPAGRGEQPIHKDVKYELEEYPEDKTEARLEKHVAPAIRYHMKDLLANMATRGRPVADIEQGYISTSCCILGNLSMKLGRTLEWDAQKQMIARDEEANRLMRRPYRKPWVHPEVKNV